MGPMMRGFFSRLNFWTLAALLLVFCVLAYAALGRHNARFDLTHNQIYSLSPKSVEILKGMGQEKITVKGFFKSDQPERGKLEDLLKIYSHHHSGLHYEFIDPDRSPGQAKAYGVDEYGTIVVERTNKRERVREASEEALTNALLKLVQAHEKTLTFVKGHGEKLLNNSKEKGYTNLRARLSAENYRIKEVLLSRDAVPQETDLIVVAGPMMDFLPGEIEVLKRYAEGGGSVLLLLDPVDTRFEHFEQWLQSYGIVLGQNVVIDKLSRLFGADYMIPVVTHYGEHKITENFNAASFMPFARTVDRAKDVPEGFKVTPLAMTSQGSWAEQDWKEIEKGQVSFEQGEVAGPVSLAVACEKEKSTTRLVVFGDSDFADNAHFYLSGNKDLILNTIAWLSGEEKLVSIRSKERESNPLVLSASQQKLVFIVPVFVLPLMSIGSGLAVLVYRKKYN